MSTALGLAMQISANTAQLGTAVQDINKRLDQMADSGKKAANDLGVLKNLEIAKVFVAGVTAVANGLMKAASGAKQLFNDSRQAIDEIGKLSSATGLSVESIQQLQLVAGESGASTDRLAKSFVRLQAEIGVGATDVDKMNKKFEKLGLTYADLGGLSPEEQFEAVADAVAGIDDPNARLSAVSDILGTRGTQEFVNTLALGGDKIRELRKEAADLGATIGDDAVRAVESMNDKLARVAFAFDKVVQSVTSELAPVVEKLTVKLLDNIKGLGVENIGKFIAESLLNFGKSFLEGLKFLVEIVAGAADGITKLLKSAGLIDENEADAQAERLTERKSQEDRLKRDAIQQNFEISELRKQLSERQELERSRGRQGATAFESATGVMSASVIEGIIERREKELAETRRVLEATRLSGEERAFLAQQDRGTASQVVGAIDGLITALDGQINAFQAAQPEVTVALPAADGTAAGNAEMVEEQRKTRQQLERMAGQTVEIPR